MTGAAKVCRADLPGDEPGEPVRLAQDIILLPQRATQPELLTAVAEVSEQAPWRQMQVPGGATMSVAMSNCGQLGWVSDLRGYRYATTDPLTGRRWPPMPALFAELANQCAAEAGLVGRPGQREHFDPDACLLNGYRKSARLSLHRDSDEQDFSYPIVSVSLGASARFVYGGAQRRDSTAAIMLHHGDVLVWGQSARLMHHGVGVPRQPGARGDTAALPGGFARINLTFRRGGTSLAQESL